MNIRHFSVGQAFARFSVAGASLLAAGAGAQIVGTGFQATYDNLAEVATFVAPDGSTYQITGPNSAVRLTGTGPATLTPQYVRPTHLSTWGQRQWDIEQFVVGTPQGERYVPQFSRGGNSWSAGMFTPSLISPPAPSPFQGNVQPSVNNPTAGNQLNFTINSGSTYDFAIRYDATTRNLAVSLRNGTTFDWANITAGFTFTSGAVVPLPANVGDVVFQDVALRLNVSGAAEPTPSDPIQSRTLEITQMFLRVGNNPQQSMVKEVNGNPTSLIATNTRTSSENTFQRSFTVWQDAVTDTEDWVIVGSAKWTWVGNAPAGAAAAMQFKIGDYFAVVPEPSTFALIAGLLGLGVAVWRWRRVR